MTLAGLLAAVVRRPMPLLASALATGVLLAAPPYFGADEASAGLRHVSLGHRLRWAPPSADEVCLALLERAQPATAPALVETEVVSDTNDAAASHGFPHPSGRVTLPVWAVTLSRDTCRQR